MRGAAVWVLALALGLTAPRRAHAQPQDDAALAEEPVEVKRTEAEVRAEIEAEPPLTTVQLRQAYPDLEIETTPHVSLGIFLGALAPFQLLGFGLSSDIYVVPRFRLSGFVSLGMVPGLHKKAIVSPYAEASVGFVAARWLSQTTVKLPVRLPRQERGRAAEPPALRRGLVPSAHSLEVAAGMLSGYYVLYRCTLDCTNPELSARTLQHVGTQLAVPFAGVRYVYYRWARSRETPFRAVQRFRFAADVLSRPINNPAAGLQNARGKVIKQSPVGARFAFQFPGFQSDPNGFATSLDFTIGYFPSPSDLMLLTSLAFF